MRLYIYVCMYAYMQLFLGCFNGWDYGDVDAVRRKADAAEEWERAAVGIEEGEEIVEVGNWGELVV